ncbi:MAG: hypothetical protein U1E76_06450 [Planctomycetota bacterium]
MVVDRDDRGAHPRPERDAAPDILWQNVSSRHIIKCRVRTPLLAQPRCSRTALCAVQHSSPRARFPAWMSISSAARQGLGKGCRVEPGSASPSAEVVMRLIEFDRRRTDASDSKPSSFVSGSFAHFVDPESGGHSGRAVRLGLSAVRGFLDSNMAIDFVIGDPRATRLGFSKAGEIRVVIY